MVKVAFILPIKIKYYNRNIIYIYHLHKENIVDFFKFIFQLLARGIIF